MLVALGDQPHRDIRADVIGLAVWLLDNPNTALGGSQQAGQTIQQRRLTAAAGAENPDKRIRTDRQTQADGNELPGVVAAAVPWRQLAWLFGRDPGPDLPPAPTL